MKKWVSNGLQLILLNHVKVIEEELKEEDVADYFLLKRKKEDLIEAIDELRKMKKEG